MQNHTAFSLRPSPINVSLMIWSIWSTWTLSFSNIKQNSISSFSYLTIIAIKFKLIRADTTFFQMKILVSKLSAYHRSLETLLIISGRSVFTTYSICWAREAATAAGLCFSISLSKKQQQWYHNLNIFIIQFFLHKDPHSNSTTSTSGHKTEQHEETSRDYNTYEWSNANIDLDDIFISVKTTKKYHDSRLKTIVKTWFQLARDQVISRF